MTRHGPDDDSVAQYVAGTLDATDLDAFEQHLIECDSCRGAVRTGAAVRLALADSARARAPRNAHRRFQPQWLAAAAIIMTIILVSRRDSSGPLGEVVPAPFVAGAARPAGDSITALVDSGMIAYSAGDFRTAARQLERAATSDTSAPVLFFLGVSLMMNRENDSALRALARVDAGSAYSTEAAYYRAKALVRLNKRDSAVAVLERAVSVTEAPQLTAFADSVRRR